MLKTGPSGDPTGLSGDPIGPFGDPTGSSGDPKGPSGDLMATPHIPLVTLCDYSLFAIGGALSLFWGTLLIFGGSY